MAGTKAGRGLGSEESAVTPTTGADTRILCSSYIVSGEFVFCFFVDICILNAFWNLAERGARSGDGAHVIDRLGFIREHEFFRIGARKSGFDEDEDEDGDKGGNGDECDALGDRGSEMDVDCGLSISDCVEWNEYCRTSFSSREIASAIFCSLESTANECCKQ